jgi:hypothetical protein
MALFNGSANHYGPTARTRCVKAVAVTQKLHAKAPLNTLFLNAPTLRQVRRILLALCRSGTLPEHMESKSCHAIKELENHQVTAFIIIPKT